MLNTVNIKTVDSQWSNAFSNEELEQIINIGESLGTTTSQIGTTDTGLVDTTIRKSKNSWILYDNCPWVFDRLTQIAAKLNANFYGFDLEGIGSLQYTVYEEDNNHYDWHWDMFVGAPLDSLDYRKQRKLTLVLHLTDPADYDGGEFELYNGKTTLVEKSYGRVYAFPSFALHRVTPVTRGTRRTLVAWFEGPDWR